MITVPELKEWLNISTNDDDEKLSKLILASLGFISDYCNRLFFETQSEFDNIQNSLSEREKNNCIILENLTQWQQMNIENARIKLICDWYEYRGNGAEYSINDAPNGIKRILQPFWIYNLIGEE